MIRITRNISLDENEIEEMFIRSAGPGGQNVNKVASAVQLRFDAVNSTSLPPEVRERLIRLAGKRMTETGELIITARRFRTQTRNRQDALERLKALVRKAAEKPRPRKKTRPTAASKKRRLDEKRRQSRTKRMRRSPSFSGNDTP